MLVGDAMWLTVIAVIMVAAMLIGPVMLMQPTAQQRRLARIRNKAAKRGIHVRLGRNPASGEPRELAVYSLIETEQRSTFKPWCLARQSLEHEINFFEEWDWVAGDHAPGKIHQQILKWLPKLPPPIRAVRVSDQSVSLYWTEGCWVEGNSNDSAEEKCMVFLESELRWLLELNKR